MTYRKNNMINCPHLIVFLLMPLIVILSLVFGGKAYGEVEGRRVEQKAGFELTVKNDLISLNANDASLKEILEEIGQRMKVEMVANIPEEVRTSANFHSLSLVEALKKLSSNYGYIMNTEKDKKKIARVFVLPKGDETGKEKPLREEVKDAVNKEKKLQPEPFKFEFDPSDFVEDEE